MVAENKDKKTNSPKRKRTPVKKAESTPKIENQALKKVLKKPGRASSGRKGSRKKAVVPSKGRVWRRLAIAWAIALMFLGGLAYGGWRFWNSDMVQTRFVYMWDYQQDIVSYSEKNKIDPFLVAAIIKNESNFNHKAVSNVGAVGLMQIMPETGQWIAKQMGLEKYEDADLYKVQTNIRMGCWYVSELDSEFHHNLTLLMMAYNAGRGQTQEWMKENNWDYNFNDPKAIPYKETREYVIRVLHDRDRYYQLYKEKLKK